MPTFNMFLSAVSNSDGQIFRRLWAPGPCPIAAQALVGQVEWLRAQVSVQLTSGSQCQRKLHRKHGISCTKAAGGLNDTDYTTSLRIPM